MLSKEELYELLQKRNEELEACKEQFEALQQGAEGLQRENGEMGIQLDEAQKLLDAQDDRIEEMERMIVALSREVETKDALEKMLNERQVKEAMKRQNVLDVSISAASCSISDNSRVTAFQRRGRQRTDSETMTTETISQLN